MSTCLASDDQSLTHCAVTGTSRTKIFCGHTNLPNQEVFNAEARAALRDSSAQFSINLYLPGAATAILQIITSALNAMKPH